ncbi:hypothetical protein XFPR_12585 [Xylella fastidiosa]|uniref:hypothetical protein n=1 Tax=Xylella fastidiosa TaxID=2371 RepID=UPI000A645683|nr:hypothetical protein [Xylella fastidiosa]MDG5824654.1 hypothetical protein [Xylella fastidiosa subsp. pauca]QPB73014.1 hypothetical protein XFPR_12585 [Xylella fastidiosa]WGZ32834.1 hypothetical protein O4444_04310 [Xylella fastidiosa subsp. pauca]
MEKSNHNKAKFIFTCVLLIGNLNAAYANQPFVSEKLILSQGNVSSITNAISSDGKVISWNYDASSLVGLPFSSYQPKEGYHPFRR